MTKQYPSQARLREAFDYHPDGYLVWRIKPSKGPDRTGQIAGGKQRDGRRHICIDGFLAQANKLIWIWHYGQVPEGIDVDHIDNDGTNDRIENLQLLTHRDNVGKAWARSKASRLPLGVSRAGSRFMAQICDGSDRRYLGRYDTPEEAAQAYTRALDDIAIAERKSLAHHLEMTEGVGALLR